MRSHPLNGPFGTNPNGAADLWQTFAENDLFSERDSNKGVVLTRTV